MSPCLGRRPCTDWVTQRLFLSLILLPHSSEGRLMSWSIWRVGHSPKCELRPYRSHQVGSEGSKGWNVTPSLPASECCQCPGMASPPQASREGHAAPYLSCTGGSQSLQPHLSLYTVSFQLHNCPQSPPADREQLRKPGEHGVPELEAPEHLFLGSSRWQSGQHFQAVSPGWTQEDAEWGKRDSWDGTRMWGGCRYRRCQEGDLRN